LGTRTAAVAVATVRGEVGINWGQIAAKEVIFVTPIVIFTFLLQRHLLRGITFGTVKG
jgi:multiple sugar transport system permease protein